MRGSEREYLTTREFWVRYMNGEEWLSISNKDKPDNLIFATHYTHDKHYVFAILLSCLQIGCCKQFRSLLFSSHCKVLSTIF